MFALHKNIKTIGRLKKRADFLHVQRQGRKWISKGLIVEIAENQDQGVRYGLTVSKKVSKLAVARNRLKRRLKAISCDVLPHYKAYNLDVVIVGRLAGQARSYEELRGDLTWCLKKMDIVPDKDGGA